MVNSGPASQGCVPGTAHCTMRARRRTVGSAGQRMPHAHVAAVATAVALFAAGCAGLSSSSQRSLEAGHRAANGGMPSLASAQHRFSAVSARVPAVARLPPVICPEAKAIGGPSTLFIFVGDAVTPEVNATLMRLHELPGDVTFVRMGANSSVVPPLAKFKIIVYWDMVERVVSSPRISATMPNKASCKETAENVRQWFNAQPSRAAVLDGRAASMFLTGELTEGGSRELQSMWQYVAASASGGVVILGGDSSQQGCMRTFMPAIGFTTFRDMVAPDESGIPGDARHEMWMCPQPALHRSSAYWDVFGYPARYAISAFASGGVVPVGTQVNGLFMRGVAYYGGGASFNPCPLMPLQRRLAPHRRRRCASLHMLSEHHSSAVLSVFAPFPPSRPCCFASASSLLTSSFPLQTTPSPPWLSPAPTARPPCA